MKKSILLLALAGSVFGYAAASTEDVQVAQEETKVISEEQAEEAKKLLENGASVTEVVQFLEGEDTKARLAFAAAGFTAGAALILILAKLDYLPKWFTPASVPPVK